MHAFARHFDRTVVISLPDKTERRERLLLDLTACGLACEDTVVWQKAVNGHVGTLHTLWKQSPGAWGCRASHLQALQEAVAAGVETLLILEDDACFHPRTAQWLAELMPLLPEDWDLFFLGGQHMTAPSATAHPKLQLGRRIGRTHAYAIHCRAFAKLIEAVGSLEEYQANPSWHVDHQLGSGMLSGRWKAYAPAWWLAGQEEGASSISGRELSRRWWQQGHGGWLLPFAILPEDATPQAYSPWLLWADAPDRWETLGRMQQAQFLRSAAEAAWEQGSLPGCRLPEDYILPLWPAGVRKVHSVPQMQEIADFPLNGLFPHSFNS